MSDAIDQITPGLSRPYFRNILKKLEEKYKENADTICKYILTEQAEINIKNSTKEGKIKILVWLSNFFDDKKRYQDMSKQDYNLGNGERIAEQEFLAYKHYQVHTLKFRDSVINFDTPESQQIMNRILNSFHFIESPLRQLQYYDKILASDPDDYSILRNKSSLLYELGNYTEAIDVYDKILESYTPNEISFSDRTVLYEKGISLGILGNYTDALKVYDGYLSVDPDSPAVSYVKAIVLEGLGNWTEAIEWYDKSVEYYPDFVNNHTFVNAMTSKGDALATLGRYTEALESYDKALEVNSSDTLALSSKGDLLNFLVDTKNPFHILIKYYRKILMISLH